MDPKFLELAEVLQIHDDQITRYGGTHGLRDVRLLESAIAMPQAGIGGEYFHSDIFEMAAAYLFHIVMNHPFLDGNKRAGAAAALVFLVMNGVQVTISNEALVTLVLSVAESKHSKAEVASFLRAHSRR